MEYFRALRASRLRDIEVLLKPSYKGIWETAIKKYSDTAHFVFELLQNADDAGATAATFELVPEGLWFKHNGTARFTVSDPETEEADSKAGKIGHLNAITSIGNSSKQDEQKIGKFGIGFKAVFAYSNTPHIYDGALNFKLEKYIVPVGLDSIPERKSAGETLFYFPFDHPAKSQSEAYPEILKKLESLFQPILFLRNLQQITWSAGEASGEYGKRVLEKEEFGTITASLLESWSVEDEERVSERIWLFETAATPDATNGHHISVGYYITPKNELKAGTTYKAFCYFPTKEETNLGFLVHAPFLLTDNREGIRAGDPWNIKLIQGLADLAAESLLLLKTLGDARGYSYFHDGFLEYLPYKKPNPQDASNNSRISFAPFYHTILQQFQSYALLPGIEGKYFHRECAYWASDPEVSHLFSDAQLSMLMGNPESGWVFLNKGQKSLNTANRQLEEYIFQIVKDSVDPKKLIRRITVEFMEGQSDEWIIQFYTYLAGRKSLWEDKEMIALKRPILLNQKRKAVVPYDDGHKAYNIFLPVGRKTSYDTIYRAHTEVPEAMDFFKSLGIKAPDLGDEIIKDILPQYDDNFDYGNDELLTQHLESFLTYYRQCPASEQAGFLDRLKGIRFVATKTPADPDRRWFCKPGSCYFNTPEIRSYFDGHKSVYLMDEQYYEARWETNKVGELKEMFARLGVHTRPRLLAVKIPYDGNSISKFQLGGFEFSKTYPSNNIIKDRILEGLAEALETISFKTSVLIWRYLLEHLQFGHWSGAQSAFGGTFEYLPKYAQYHYESSIPSSLIQLLSGSKWLYTVDGELVQATTVMREQLHPDYDLQQSQSKELLQFLGIGSIEGNATLTDEQRQALRIGRELLQQGVSIEEALRALAAIRQKNTTVTPNEKGDEGSDDGAEDQGLEDFLNKLKEGVEEVRKEKSTHKDDEDVSNPESLFTEDSVDDEDEYTRPAIDLQKRHDRLMADAAAQVAELYRIERLHQVVNSSERYSFVWFKTLLELEYLQSAEANANGRTISLEFSSVELEAGTSRVLVLRHPNRYIPQSIEDIGDLHIQLVQAEGITHLAIEVVSVKEYTLRAKVKSVEELKPINLDNVRSALIDVKNPVFLLAELKKAFGQLPFHDNYNLRDNLTKDIKFIFGPPGTGKTTCLATQEIIPRMLGDVNTKILVLTPTNKAADVLTNRIITMMGDDESYLEWLVRFGTSGDPALENSPIVKDNRSNIRNSARTTLISTVARFSYDYFKAEEDQEKTYLKHGDWDYIIIDEASMVTLANVAFVLHQCPKARFIVAGDPFQIQPIATIREWKEMNIYEMVRLNRFANATTVPHRYEVQLLTTQYRSLPSIGSVFSNFLYDGILKHHRASADQRPVQVPGLEFKDINLIKFPVTKFESIYRPNRLNKSNYQIYSALFAVEFVQRLRVRLGETYPDGYRIGVICPYRAQATLVEKMLAQLPKGGRAVDVQVGTIHGFQGDECDLILAILNPPRNISTSTDMFLNKRNILNVAISRAKDYLFLLMPDDETANVENLQGIKAIEGLVQRHAGDRSKSYRSGQVEEVLFGESTYIEENSFATSHQSVNVYSKPAKRYEVRCEDVAIDVQMEVV